MKAKKITEGEIADLKISSLPTRPCAPTSFGGRGYTSVEMKAAFDKLPLFIVERYNALLDDIFGEGLDSIAREIKTGIAEGHTLCELCSDLADGSAAAYITVLGESLAEWAASVNAEIAELRSIVGGKK
jgi:hypothetical protein